MWSCSVWTTASPGQLDGVPAARACHPLSKQFIGAPRLCESSSMIVHSAWVYLPRLELNLCLFLWHVVLYHWAIKESHKFSLFFFFFECAKSKHKDMRYPKDWDCYMIEMGLQQGSLQRHHLDCLWWEYCISLISLHIWTNMIYMKYIRNTTIRAGSS